MGRRVSALVLCACCVCLAHTPPILALPASLSGSVQIDASNGDIEGEHQSALNQRYALNWSRRLFPYLRMRASFNYDRLGTVTGGADEVWREQLRPVGELLWTHPDFTFNTTVSRIESNSVDRTTSLIREMLDARFSTRSVSLPIVSLQYNAVNTYNQFSRADRDTREDRYEVGVTYNVGTQSFYYDFVRRDNNVRSSDLVTVENTHQFVWSQSTQMRDQRLRLNSDYRFSHRREDNTYGGRVSAFLTIPVVAALYAQDATPDLSTLDTVTALADGNLTEPTSPRIDIGENTSDQNIGVDLGFAQDVRGLYIYTDRPSGTGVTWSVYTSSDNVNWEPLDETVDVVFITSFSRYELLFPVTNTRYIKAVSGGLNNIVTVYVTEIEAISEELSDRHVSRSQASHQGSTALTYAFRENLQSTASFAFRAEPQGDFTNSRNQIFYGLSTRYIAWDALTQTLSAQAGHETFSASGEKQSNTSLTYIATLAPLRTLSFTGSVADRRNLINDRVDVETKSALLRSRAVLLPRLTMTTNMTYARTEQPIVARQLDTWTYQAGLDLGLHRAMDALVTYLYQTIDESGGEPNRDRWRATARLTWRLSRTIRLQGSASRNDDDGRVSTLQEYSGSWQLSGGMSVTGLTTFYEGTTGSMTRRSSVLYSLMLNNRTSVNVTYTETDSGEENGTDINTLQFGVRTTF